MLMAYSFVTIDLVTKLYAISYLTVFANALTT